MKKYEIMPAIATDPGHAPVSLVSPLDIPRRLYRSATEAIPEVIHKLSTSKPRKIVK
jgi:hypothetical protein